VLEICSFDATSWRDLQVWWEGLVMEDLRGM